MTSTALLPHPSEKIPEWLGKQGLEDGQEMGEPSGRQGAKALEETPCLFTLVCSHRPSDVVFVFPLSQLSNQPGQGGRNRLRAAGPHAVAPRYRRPQGQSSGVALRPIGHLRRFPRSPRWHKRAAGAGMDEFTLPAEPAALWEPDSEHLGLRCEQWVDLSETDAAELADLAESERAAQLSVAVELGQLRAPPRPGAPPGDVGGAASIRPGAVVVPAAAGRRRRRLTPRACPPSADLAFVLCDQDPLCIVEQANFDQLCSLAAVFGRVAGPKRRQLIDSLCSSLTCLNAWIDKLLATPVDQQDPEAVRQHRSAFKAYLFFLAWISGLAAREARDAAAAAPAPSAASQAPSGRGGRKKKAAADSDGLLVGWDWSAQFPKVVKAVAQAMNTDLWALHRPSAPEEAMLIKAMQLVRPAGSCCAMCALPALCCVRFACAVRALLHCCLGTSTPCPLHRCSCAHEHQCCLRAMPLLLLHTHCCRCFAAGHQRAGGPGSAEE